MLRNGKIKDIEELASELAKLRIQNQKIVHCHGVFDLMHVGHIRHFEAAKQMGDLLVVTVTPDRYVNKGPNRPVFNEDLRASSISALACVNYVAINRWPMATDTIRLLKPDIFVKGSEFQDVSLDRTGNVAMEAEVVREVGGKFAVTDDITFSSSSLLNRHLSVFPKEVEDYLATFASRYRSADVVGCLERARDLKVLVVGDAIIDEYVYCETMGKSGKEPVLAARYNSSEKFAGGVLAVANQVASVSDHTTLLTFLGKTDSQEEFIREKMRGTVDNIFLYLDHVPTIVKRRFVETYPFQKLFELYVMNEEEDQATQSEALCAKLKELLPQFDVVIVADYGHGMMSPQAVKTLSHEARFLAVNTQMNAGNLGFNTISKYPRADYICISEKEIRLEARSRCRDLSDIVRGISEQLCCNRIMVTRGQQGSVFYSAEEGFQKTPAFATRVVDRIGAGDAVLAVTSLCAAVRAPMEVIGFVGSAVGAEAVAVVGNRSYIERVPLIRHMECLMK